MPFTRTETPLRSVSTGEGYVRRLKEEKYVTNRSLEKPEDTN